MSPSLAKKTLQTLVKAGKSVAQDVLDSLGHALLSLHLLSKQRTLLAHTTQPMIVPHIQMQTRDRYGHPRSHSLKRVDDAGEKKKKKREKAGSKKHQHHKSQSHYSKALCTRHIEEHFRLARFRKRRNPPHRVDCFEDHFLQLVRSAAVTLLVKTKMQKRQTAQRRWRVRPRRGRWCFRERPRSDLTRW